MFQTGTLKTKLKYIKMNQSNEDFEIPVPWFLIKHPTGKYSNRWRHCFRSCN